MQPGVREANLGEGLGLLARLLGENADEFYFSEPAEYFCEFVFAAVDRKSGNEYPIICVWLSLVHLSNYNNLPGGGI